MLPSNAVLLHSKSPKHTIMITFVKLIAIALLTSVVAVAASFAYNLYIVLRESRAYRLMEAKAY